ncbi:MAG: hypothetical protein ACK5MZ_05725 [Aestuariibaculum sp.]
MDSNTENNMASIKKSTIALIIVIAVITIAINIIVIVSNLFG